MLWAKHTSRTVQRSQDIIIFGVLATLYYDVNIPQKEVILQEIQSKCKNNSVNFSVLQHHNETG